MIYPKWLPRPKCWLRSIELLLYNIPVMVITGIFGVYYLSYGYALFVGNDSHILYYVISGIVIIFGLMMLGFAYVYDFFWGKHDEPKVWKYLPPKSSLWEGFWRVVFSIISYIIALILIFPFIKFYDPSVYPLAKKYVLEENRHLGGIYYGLWILICAYCFHWKNLILQDKIVTK